MIPNREGREAKSEGRWHYLAVKKLSALRGFYTRRNFRFTLNDF